MEPAELLEDEEIISVGLKATSYSNLIDRFFTKLYINKGTDSEQYVFIHSNGIVVCGLGANNSLILGKKIKSLVDLGKLVEVKGKRKHGAKILQDTEYIIEIKYMNDANEEVTYKFAPKVNKAKLMEINKNAILKPEIVIESPEKFGFLCILFLDLPGIEAAKLKYQEK